MRRFLLSTAATLGLVACQPKAPESAKADTDETPATPTAAAGTNEWKIETFSSAAPPAIAANATVMDWNDSTKAPTTQLRKGSNGWTCMPLNPPPAGGYTTTAQSAPMCGDSMAMLWGQGFITKTKPKNTAIGLAYMLHGDVGASNTDPNATGPTAQNDWVVTGPHVMVLPANPSNIAAVPADHGTGEPFQMWKGTQYAHVMMPVGQGQMKH